MKKPRLADSFVLRLFTLHGAQWLSVHNLRSGEMRDFADWDAFLRYVKALSPPKDP